MWDLIKNNPIIKIVLVLIFGIIGFGILFNVLFGLGYGNNYMGHGSGYGGINSTTGVLVYLYSVFFKLLVFALVISFVALAVRVFYKYTSGTAESLLKLPLTDPYVKATAVLGISVVTLFIATPILSGLLGINMYQGMSSGYGRMVNGYGYMQNQYGYNGFTVNEIIILVLKIFLILSVIGVLVGLAMYGLKNYKGLVSNVKVADTCFSCDSKIDKTAHYCPNCGQKKPAADSQRPETESSNSQANTPKTNEKSKNLITTDTNNPDNKGGIPPTT